MIPLNIFMLKLEAIQQITEYPITYIPEVGIVHEVGLSVFCFKAVTAAKRQILAYETIRNKDVISR